ncbi:ankyrin repeat protein, partial [Trifolium medium]|nr:ankyrin repeat protein [Trifolium medium]
MQAVEDILHPMCKDAKNGDGKKPFDVFTESHEELVKAGEQWTKDTARTYIAVDSLVL